MGRRTGESTLGLKGHQQIPEQGMLMKAAKPVERPINLQF
jgi:hypothetical protein